MMSTKEALQDINQKIDQITKLYIEVTVLVEKASWNEAVEAVIYELDKIGHSTDNDIEQIRKLKK